MGLETPRVQNNDKREYTTDREVDTIPQIVHCLQTIEVNPQLQLNCIKKYSTAPSTGQ